MRLLFGTTVFLISLFATNITQTDYRESFKGREWEFLQYEIEKKFDKQLADRTFIPGLRGMAIICAGTYVLFKCFTHRLDMSKYEDQQHYELCLSIAIVSGFITHGVLFLALGKIAELIRYDNFVCNWPQNRVYTPECFHSILDEIYAIRQQYGEKSKEFEAKLSELVQIITQALQNKFPPPVKVNNYTYVPIYR